MRLPRAWRLAMLVALAILAVVFVVLSYQNSLAVSSVAIKLRDGAREPLDPSVLGVGREHQLPDYCVKLHVQQKLLNVNLGTKLNTSATNWLEFPVRALVPLRRIQEVIVIEDDRVANDVVERHGVVGPLFEGRMFSYRLATERSFKAGMEWFFDTPVGKVVSGALILLLLALIFYTFQS